MSEQGSARNGPLSRRDFLKLLGVGGVALAFVPFVSFGNFMPNPRNENLGRQKIILPDGTQANVNSFPINHAETITYPSTGDPALDAEAFRKWQFIRLPAELGGSEKSVNAFRPYSNVCLHLWCLWKYWPTTNPDKPMNIGYCPCHGSEYDPLTGRSTLGPASLQAPPSNVLPKLDLDMDDEGFLYILPPTWGINDNGVIGYGRLA